MLSMTTTKQYQPVKPVRHKASCKGLGPSLGLVRAGQPVECNRCVGLCERIKVKA
jgi:hypothetical protein